MSKPISIPLEALSEAALQGVIEAFVLREGTDYGHVEVDLEQKRAAVLRALETGAARLVYLPDEDFVDIQLID